MPFGWNQYVPIRRKVFVSYHHEDQFYRDRWDAMFGHLFISKSVGRGEIADDLSTDYVARLIREDYVRDTSVVVVLVGPRTYCRKHVDWEIAAGLSTRVGGRSGLLGLVLPHHPGFGHAVVSPLPARLADNVRPGFASLYNWTEDATFMQSIIEEAFVARLRSELCDNRRGHLPRNLC